MIWHWVVFGVLAILVFVEQFIKVNKKYIRGICFFISIVFIFLASIRWNQYVADWDGYYKIFGWQSIDSFLDIFRVGYWAFEPLHFLIFRIIKYFTDNYVIVQVYMAFIAIGLYYYGARYATTSTFIAGKRYGDSHSILLATYLVFWCTTFAHVYTVRTNMAVAVCLFSLRYIEEKNNKKFMFCVLIAALLHFTAIVFVLAYFVYHKKMNIKNIIISLVVCIVISFIGIDKILGLASLLGGRYAEKVQRYNIQNGTANYSYYSYSTAFLIVRALANSLLVLSVCFVIKRNLKNDTRFSGMVNLYYLGVLIQLLTVTYNVEVSRLAMYFQTFQYFLLPYSFRAFKKRNMKFLVYMIFILYMAVKMYSLYNREPGYATFNNIWGR